jgi:aminoglycoside phosphotransferase (APT) family kinase protein
MHTPFSPSEPEMTMAPDGVEVVTDHAAAARLVAPPLLVLDQVATFLDAAGVGYGPLAWRRIGEGQSNVTYLLERAGERVVLRRGPRPPLPRSTHDMIREARIQRMLRERGLAVPRIIAVCDDASLLGVPFYVMEYLEGEVVTDRIPPSLESTDDRRRGSEEVVDLLVRLHAVDATTGELSRLGRPAGYLERQVARFAGLWIQSTQRELPEVAQLAAWLGAHVPASARSTVVHGDYRLGNLMLAADAPPRVLALLDWEMATLGDPLADLGYLTATWAEAGSEPTVMELSPVTAAPGFLRRDELVARYQEQTGADVSGLGWYQALALWKAAIFSEAIYTRWLRGERPDDQVFGPSLERGVPRLLEAAREFIPMERSPR